MPGADHRDEQAGQEQPPRRVRPRRASAAPCRRRPARGRPRPARAARPSGRPTPSAPATTKLRIVPGQVDEAGLDRRQPEHLLQVERHVEEHREERRRDPERRDLRARERRVAEQAAAGASAARRAPRSRRTRTAARRRRRARRRSARSPQPSSLPRSSASTSRNRPPVERDVPGTSTRGARGSLDSATKRRTIHRHDACPIGRLMRKIHASPGRWSARRRRAGRSANEAPIVAP